MIRLEAGEREAAITILQRRLSLHDLRSVVTTIRVGGGGRKRKGIEWIVAETENTGGRLRSRLPDEDIAGFLVDVMGVDLLSLRELRYRLALGASEDELDRLHEYQPGGARRSRSSVARAVADRNWHAGKSWATHFGRTLGFPLVLAGIAGSPSEPDSEELIPFKPLPPLQDFQVDLKMQVLDVLRTGPGSNRGILSLPTGAGKTRTAVESLVEWRLAAAGNAGILWIAQSDELCEQAVQAFREVWTDLGHRTAAVTESLTVDRLWGPGRPVPSEADVVVASIQKLHAVWRGQEGDSRKKDLAELGHTIGAVVVDEAHRILASSYGEVLGFLGIDVIRGAESTVPLLGLTATPFRGQEEETRRLASRFHGRLLRPSDLGADPVEELRSRGVLSRPVHRVAPYTGRALSVDETPKYRDYYEQFKDFHPELLRELGEERARNRIILEILADLPSGWPTLFFGCSVEHASAMAALLRRRGRSAETVTSNTRGATRRFLIEEFRAGRLSVLSNYGVLTTGFDAPQIRALVISRPTASPVLYEQMIGRGMRGPVFGGTEECLVVDVEDNIQFGGHMAFRRYEHYWS